MTDHHEKKNKPTHTWSAGDVVRVRYYQKKHGKVPRIGYGMVVDNRKRSDPHVYIHWLWNQQSLSSYENDLESYGFGPTDYAIQDEEWSAIPCSMVMSLSDSETIPVVRFKCRFHPRFELTLLSAKRQGENEKELSTRILTLEQKLGELTSSLATTIASAVPIPTVVVSPLELPQSCLTKRKRNQDDEEESIQEEEKESAVPTTTSTAKQTKKKQPPLLPPRAREKKDPIQRLSSLERIVNRFKSNYEDEMESLKSQLFHCQNVIHSLQTKSEIGSDALVPVPVRNAATAAATTATIDLNDDDIVIPASS
jgi:hypothetical protein